MSDYRILRECMAIHEMPDTFLVSINGRTHLLAQEIHGDEDGSLASKNFVTQDEGILREVAAITKSLGMKDRWVIHPCHPAKIKEEYPEYANHIIGDWPEPTHHYHVFGNVLVVSNPMRWEIMNSANGIAEFVQEHIGEPITNAQVQEYEKSRTDAFDITQTTRYFMGNSITVSIGEVIFHQERPPFVRRLWD